MCDCFVGGHGGGDGAHLAMEREEVGGHLFEGIEECFDVMACFLWVFGHVACILDALG